MVTAALRNPYAVVVGALALLVVGLSVVGRLPTDILPTFRTPAVQVLTFYPGMPAEIVEQDITTRLERWTGQANGIARQESKSMIGVSIVKDFFREDADPNAAMAQVTSLAMSDLYYLPPGTIPPMVMPFDPTASIPLALVSVSSPSLDETQLYDVAYFGLRNRLQSISGVIAPAVYGGKLRRILAYVDPQKAQARGLSPLDVIDAIRSSNVMIPTGSAKFGALDYQIRANGMVSTVDELNDIPLKIGNGAPSFVRDVASVEDSHQIQTNIVRIDGKRQVYIPIYRQPGANTIQVVDGIRAALAPILERIKDVNLEVVMDQSFTVRESIRNLVQEAVIGSLLAALLVLVFLGSRRAMGIVLIALPLAGLGALIGLYTTGDSLNAMTLGGLALAVGLLIDQSVVVIENTERHLAMGKDPVDAARQGALEVARPLLIITFTLAVVFFPVVFLTGIGKFLFTPLARTVIFALATSYVLALTLVPVCAARFLRRHGEAEQRWFARLRRRYESWLAHALHWRWTVLVGAGLVFGISMGLFHWVGTELFPQTDSGQFMVHVRGPTGLRIERTEDRIVEIEQAIAAAIPESERQTIISNIGVLLDWPAAYTPNSGSQDAFVLVQLAEEHERSTFDYVAALRSQLPAAFPGIEFSFDTGGILSAALNGGLPAPIDVQVEGNQLGPAREIAEKIRRFAGSVPGAVDVRIQQRLDAPAINIEVDRVKAAQVGLTQENIVKNVVTALNSSINFAPSFWIDHHNGNHYFIGAQYPERGIQSLDTILDIPITGKDQSVPIPLRNLATLSRGSTPSEINHFDITRVTDVFVNVQGRDVGSVSAEIEEFIASIEHDRAQVPEGYFIRMRGEVSSMRESFQSLGFGFGLAVVLVYLVMVVQFESFRDPWIVLLAVPLGLIGVAWMLFLTGTHLSIQSFMGVIMMIGIVVSFSVLLVDFANRRLAELRAAADGEPDVSAGRGPEPDTDAERQQVHRAIREAASIRLRPILMTGLAAILGLLPMAIAGGANIPLARAVVGGILAALVLVLFVVPPLYVVVKAPRERGAGASR